MQTAATTSKPGLRDRLHIRHVGVAGVVLRKSGRRIKPNVRAMRALGASDDHDGRRAKSAEKWVDRQDGNRMLTDERQSRVPYLSPKRLHLPSVRSGRAGREWCARSLIEGVVRVDQGLYLCPPVQQVEAFADNL